MSIAFDEGAPTGQDILLSPSPVEDSIPIVKNVGAYSISFWIQRESDTGDSQQVLYIQCQQGNPNSRFEIQFQASASLKLRSFVRAPDSGGAESGDTATIISAATLAAPNTHVVVVADPAADLIDYYIDGALDQSNSVAFTNTLFDNVDADEVYIGSGGGGVNQLLDGKIDDLRGYNRRLTLDEIMHLTHTRGHDGILPDFRWHMNDKPSGTVVVPGDMKEIAAPQHFGGSAHSMTGSPEYAPTNLSFRRRIG